MAILYTQVAKKSTKEKPLRTAKVFTFK